MRMSDNDCSADLKSVSHLYREKFRDKTHSIIFRATELFLLGKQPGSKDGKHPTAEWVAAQVAEEFGQTGLPPEQRINRNDVYDLLGAAIDLGILAVRAPLETLLATRLQEAFRLPGVNFYVVDARTSVEEFLAQQAAEVVHAEIQRVQKRKKAHGLVGLGMGPGDTTLSVCRKLANLLNVSTDLRFLKIFGISSGCPPTKPSLAPISFFNLLPQHVIDSTVAFLTEPLIPVHEYPKRKLGLGLRNVFESKDEVDVVFTSMGDCHEHDELIEMLNLTPPTAAQRDWAGSVQYRLYTKTAPYVEELDEMRVATLFEFEDLVRMAAENSGKAVVLIARPCAHCQRLKTEALKPLLTVPALRAFNHLMLDTKTALQLLEWKASVTSEQGMNPMPPA
jgi:DNA-binding transcriptional regulator LsrR (DeoR family)